MPADPRQEVTLKLLPQELDVVVQGLGQLPYFQVANLMARVQAQVRAQLVAEQPAPTGEKAEG